MLAINNRDTALGLSPFFLIYSYHAELVAQVNLTLEKRSEPKKAAEKFVSRIYEAQEFAQAAIASA